MVWRIASLIRGHTSNVYAAMQHRSELAMMRSRGEITEEEHATLDTYYAIEVANQNLAREFGRESIRTEIAFLKGYRDLPQAAIGNS